MMMGPEPMIRILLRSLRRGTEIPSGGRLVHTLAGQRDASFNSIARGHSLNQYF